MERWGVRECVCAVELFIRRRSITETQHGFHREWIQQEVPCPNTIHRWVRQWSEEGSVTCKKPPGRPSSVCAPDNIAQVLASISRSLRRSACKHAQALRMSDRNVWRILRSDLSLHPYKLQVVHALSRTFDTGQLQILMNFINAPLMTQKLPYGALFGPEESLDPTSLRMKTEKPPQSHHNITQR